LIKVFEEPALGMRLAESLMKSLRNNLSFTDEHGPDERVCADLAAALLGKLQTPVHKN